MLQRGKAGSYDSWQQGNLTVGQGTHPHDLQGVGGSAGEEVRKNILGREGSQWEGPQRRQVRL